MQGSGFSLAAFELCYSAPTKHAPLSGSESDLFAEKHAARNTGRRMYAASDILSQHTSTHGAREQHLQQHRLTRGKLRLKVLA